MRPLKTLAPLLLCLCTYASQAQNFTWATAVLDSSGSQTTTVAIDRHHNVITAGPYNKTVHVGSSTITNTSNTSNGVMIKYDSSGNVLWVKELKIPGPASSSVVLNAVATDNSDNIYITGVYSGTAIYFTATDSLAANGNFLAKYNSSGVFQWATDVQGFAQATAITVDGANNLIWAGIYADSANFSGIILPHDSAFINFFIAKYNTSGSPVWAKKGKCLNVASGLARVQSLSTDQSGNIYAAGYTPGTTIFEGGTIQDSLNWYVGFVAKFNSSGVMQWYDTMHGAYAGNQTNGVAADASGNVYTCGEITDSLITMEIPFIAKYNAAGNRQWVKKMNGNSNDYANGIALDFGGYPYIAGSYSTSITVGSTTLNSARYSAFVAKFDPSGNAVWAKTAKGQSAAAAISVDQATGNIALAGTFYTADTFGTKVVPTYNLYKGNMFVAYISSTATGVAIPLAITTSPILYPNPATSELHIDQVEVNTAITIYNTIGQRVYSGFITNRHEPVNISKLVKGLYYLQLTSATGSSQTMSFVKE